MGARTWFSVAAAAAVIGAAVWISTTRVRESKTRPAPGYPSAETRTPDASDPEVATRPAAPTTPIVPRQFEDPERAPETDSRPATQPAGRFVKGRLLGDDRVPPWVPFISAIEVVRGGANPSSHQSELLLGEDGSFRLAITEPFDPAASDARRELIFTARAVRRREPTYGARVDLTRDVPPGDTDLGTITLTPAPLIAAGMVVDQTGEGVSAAWITPGLDAGQATIVDRASETERLRELEVESDDTGAFEVRGFTDASELTLKARKHGWKTSETVRALRGAAGVRLVLTRGGAFEGKVLVDPSVPITLMVVEFQPEALRPEDARMSRISRCEPDGTFRYKSDGAAMFRIVVGATGVDEPLADVPGVALIPGETTRDPRLDPLDLRGRLRVIDVKVVDPDGRPVPEAVVFIEPKPNATSEFGSVAVNGTASILTTQSAVDLRVEAHGFRVARVPGVNADTRVMLRSAIRASFRLEGELPKLPAGTTAQIKLVPPGPEDHGESNFIRHIMRKGGGGSRQQGPRTLITRTMVEFPLDASWSSSDFPVPEPGTYVVQLMLEQRVGNGSNGISVNFASPPRVVVKDQDGVQALSCQAPASAAVLESLKQLSQ